MSCWFQQEKLREGNGICSGICPVCWSDTNCKYSQSVYNAAPLSRSHGTGHSSCSKWACWLALFLACVVVDDILALLYLEEINEQLTKGCLGREIVHMVQSMLLACHAMSVYCVAGVGVAPVKQSKINLLLEDFEAGDELAETCQCICDLDRPFFHPEVVKKALVTAMEKKNNRVLSLLSECSQEGLINTSQLGKGFSHVLAWMTSLNITDAKEKVTLYMAQAKQEGWLNLNFDQT